MKKKTAKTAGRTPPDPERMFKHAAVFEFVALFLSDYSIKKLNAAPPGVGVAIPDAARIVNSALSLELYLKCLLSIEKGDYDFEHELVKLFNAISPARQLRIKELFVEEFNRIPHLVYLRQVATDKKEYEFDRILERANHAFVEWRYAFEGLESGVQYNGQPVRNAVRRVILEIKPDWIKILESLDTRPTYPTR